VRQYARRVLEAPPQPAEARGVAARRFAYFAARCAAAPSLRAAEGRQEYGRVAVAVVLQAQAAAVGGAAAARRSRPPPTLTTIFVDADAVDAPPRVTAPPGATTRRSFTRAPRDTTPVASDGNARCRRAPFVRCRRRADSLMSCAFAARHRRRHAPMPDAAHATHARAAHAAAATPDAHVTRAGARRLIRLMPFSSIFVRAALPSVMPRYRSRKRPIADSERNATRRHTRTPLLRRCHAMLMIC